MYKSQSGQDKFLEENIFKGYKNGIFIDVGAYDGLLVNNTYYFEKYNQWTGINIEPMKKAFSSLELNRPNCININCAVSGSDGIEPFYNNTGFTTLTSGLKNTYDDRHLKRLHDDTKNHPEWYDNDDNNISVKTSTTLIDVETKRLETIFEDNNITHVNYLSIDVEGAEYEVIKSINFDKVFIDVIMFENNYEDYSKPIVSYLNDNQYKKIKHSTDIYMIHAKSKFLQ